VRQNAGQDRGVNFVYGKNIVNIQASEDWSNVVTKLMPVGKDGLLLDEIWLELDEHLYDIPYTKVVSFD
jgi:phage minor structural protein